MTPEQLSRLAADPKLTPDAVRLVLYVASLGEGEHEIDAEMLRMLLRCKGDKPIYNAREAARGWLRWRQGGRQHANRYEYLAPQEEVNEGAAPYTSPPGERYTTYVAPRGEVSASAGGTIGGDRSVPTPTDQLMGEIGGVGERDPALAAKAPPKPSRRERLTPLPDDWAPNERHREIAKEEGVHLEREAEKFRSYCLANGKRYLNHDQAFANWLRNDQYRKPAANGNGRPPGYGTMDNPGTYTGGPVRAADGRLLT